MAGRDWSEAVEEAVRWHVDSTGDPVFTRRELIDAELDRIISETGSEGETPHMTLSRELQQLRDAGVLDFVDDRGLSADWLISRSHTGSAIRFLFPLPV